LLKHSIKYGKCDADFKDSRRIRDTYSREDYVFGAQFKNVTQELLADLGFPMPEEDEVFRDSFYDRLNLKSHGLVVKIGPTDIIDKINPLFLQPIGWKSAEDIIGDIKLPFTVAVYPRINRASMCGLSKMIDFQSNLFEMTQNLGLNYYNINIDNVGFIDVVSDGLEKESVPLYFDVQSNENISDNISYNSAKFFINNEGNKIHNKGELLDKTIKAVSLHEYGIEKYVRAFEVHQPLRLAFWNACGDNGIDKAKLDNLWNECSFLTSRKKQYEYPVWRVEKGEYKRKIIKGQKISLCTTWRESKKSPKFQCNG